MELLTLNCHSWQEDNQYEKIKIFYTRRNSTKLLASFFHFLCQSLAHCPKLNVEVWNFLIAQTMIAHLARIEGLFLLILT